MVTNTTDREYGEIISEYAWINAIEDFCDSCEVNGNFNCPFDDPTNCKKLMDYVT
jgi:hypothetical protein